MKYYLTLGLFIYLIPGIIIASCLAWAVPATSFLGWLYLIVIWPWWLAHGYIIGVPMPPVPSWCFHFAN